jgi:polyferredoxin
MNKTAEILSKQKRQNQLKKEVKRMKKKIPVLFIVSIFFVGVTLFLVEKKFNIFFHNHVDFIIGMLIFLGLFSLIFVLISDYITNKKIQKYKALGSELYHLMKLKVSDNND